MQINSQSVSTDAILRLVANPRRRALIRQLMKDDDRAVTVDELVDGVAEVESPPRQRYQDYVNRVAVDLHHVQLRKLAEANVIEYDARSEDIRYRRQEPVEKLLRFVTEELE